MEEQELEITNEQRSAYLVSCLQYSRKKTDADLEILVDCVINRSKEIKNVEFAEVNSLNAVEIFTITGSHFTFWIESGQIEISKGKYPKQSERLQAKSAIELVDLIVEWSTQIV